MTIGPTSFICSYDTLQAFILQNSWHQKATTLPASHPFHNQTTVRIPNLDPYRTYIDSRLSDETEVAVRTAFDTLRKTRIGFESPPGYRGWHLDRHGFAIDYLYHIPSFLGVLAVHAPTDINQEAYDLLRSIWDDHPHQNMMVGGAHWLAWTASLKPSFIDASLIAAFTTKDYTGHVELEEAGARSLALMGLTDPSKISRDFLPPIKASIPREEESLYRINKDTRISLRSWDLKRVGDDVLSEIANSWLTDLNDRVRLRAVEMFSGADDSVWGRVHIPHEAFTKILTDCLKSQDYEKLRTRMKFLRRAVDFRHLRPSFPKNAKELIKPLTGPGPECDDDEVIKMAKAISIAL